MQTPENHSENMIQNNPMMNNMFDGSMAGMQQPSNTYVSAHSRVNEISTRLGHTVALQLFSVPNEETMFRRALVQVGNSVQIYMIFRVSLPFPQSKQASRHMRPIWLAYREDDWIRMDRQSQKNFVSNMNHSAFRMVQNEAPVKEGGNIFNSYFVTGKIMTMLVPGVSDWSWKNDNYYGRDYNEFKQLEQSQLNSGRLTPSNVIFAFSNGMVPTFSLQSAKPEDVPFMDFNTLSGQPDPKNPNSPKHPMTHPATMNMFRGMVYTDFSAKAQGESGANIRCGLQTNMPNRPEDSSYGLIGNGIVLADGLDTEGTSVIFEYNDNVKAKVVDDPNNNITSRAKSLFEQAAGKPLHLDTRGTLRINDQRNGENQFAVWFRISVAQQQIISSSSISTQGSGATLEDFYTPNDLNEVTTVDMASPEEISEESYSEEEIVSEHETDQEESANEFESVTVENSDEEEIPLEEDKTAEG